MNALAIITAVLLVIAISLAVMLLRLRREKAALKSVTGAEGKGDLEDAVRELAELAKRGAGAQTMSARLENLLATYPKPVLLLDESRIIIDLSSQAEAELDQPRRRRGLLETMGSHGLDEAVRLAIEELKSREATVRLYAGGRRPYNASIFPFKNGERRECIVFLEDISTSIKFGELRSQFAANVSHELRTPLAGIRALVEILRDPDILPEDAARFLARVDQETGRLSQLIEEILFLSRLESGAIESIRGETDLGSVVDQILMEKEPLARKFEVSTENEVAAGISFPLNERMAATVLSNLVDNAIKYSGRGSRVRVSAEKEGERIRLVVSDDGIGIDAEHLPHIFERFYRVDKSRSRRLGGTGLGLSIVKHIVESAGGEIEARSREGFGTEMVVKLPAASGPKSR